MPKVVFSEIIEGYKAELIVEDDKSVSVYYKGIVLKNYEKIDLDEFTKVALTRLNVYNYLDLEGFNERLFFDD